MSSNIYWKLSFDNFTKIYQKFVIVKSNYQRSDNYDQQQQMQNIKSPINDVVEKIEKVTKKTKKQIGQNIFFSDEQYQPVSIKKQSVIFTNPKRSVNKRQKSMKRKQRTTITKQKLQIMNKMFQKFQYEKENQVVSSMLSLREIGKQLSLGYSTILHKYQQYKVDKVVMGGLRLSENKRKYKKSVQIQEYILKATSQNKFNSVVQLSKFIYKQYKIIASRSILSRHLNSLGISFRNPSVKLQQEYEINSWQTNYSKQSLGKAIFIKKEQLDY